MATFPSFGGAIHLENFELIHSMADVEIPGLALTTEGRLRLEAGMDMDITDLAGADINVGADMMLTGEAEFLAGGDIQLADNGNDELEVRENVSFISTGGGEIRVGVNGVLGAGAKSGVDSGAITSFGLLTFNSTGDIRIHEDDATDITNHITCGNMTGTNQAYRPPGHVLESGQRDKAYGDYKAWTPPE